MISLYTKDCSKKLAQLFLTTSVKLFINDTNCHTRTLLWNIDVTHVETNEKELASTHSVQNITPYYVLTSLSKFNFKFHQKEQHK